MTQEPYVIGEWSDGALEWKHPATPKQGAHYYGFAECGVCEGTGAILWRRHFGGTSKDQCLKCARKRYSVKWAYEDRTQEILERLKALTKEAKKLSQSKDWETFWHSHPVPQEYRALVRELWERPKLNWVEPTLVWFDDLTQEAS